VVGKFWRLKREQSDYVPAPGDSVGGLLGGFATDDEVGWEGEEARFLRRFDLLLGSSMQALSFPSDEEPVDSIITGDGLSHLLFWRSYNHVSPSGTHWGSRQDLLGKSRWGLVSSGYGQNFFGARTIDKLDSQYLDPGLNEDHPKRELSDWVSPGWFCFGVGGVLAEGLTSEDEVIQLTDALDAYNFMHVCWGETEDPQCNGNYDVTVRTYIMVLPEGYNGMEIADSDRLPVYEIMKVTDIDPVNGLLYVERGQYTTEAGGYVAGSEVRPLVWTNPNNFGSVSFLMNGTTYCPPVYIEGQEFRWYDMAALFVRYHDLRSKSRTRLVDVERESFYLEEGIRLDTYQDDPLRLKLYQGKCQMFLHSEMVDYDLDGEPDCTDASGGYLECRWYDYEELYGDSPVVVCDDAIVDAWREGYVRFIKLVREYADSIRNDDDSLYIITNGFPDTTRFMMDGDEYSVSSLVNGMYFEDTNDFYKDRGWGDVKRKAEYCDKSSELYDPRFVVFFERDRGYVPFEGADPEDYTNLAQMRLTLALSLMIGEGFYGTTGSHSSRSGGIFEDGEIEDYYDEYAVDYWGRGFWHPEFQAAYSDSEGYLLGARYYLGEPLAGVKQYGAGGHDDIYYREFDHGLVIVHMGTCDINSTVYDVNLDNLDLVEDPRDDMSCAPYGGWEGCHFMRIAGDPAEGSRYNDGKNDGAHPAGPLVLVDDVSDDDEYGRGDALILLKENDGFAIHGDHF
jgi:hypothetical protein